jgi:ABC-type branched-subunit amino acid transport system ATPase component/branched-subunit amino acid ABC-type transport system permease component
VDHLQFLLLGLGNGAVFAALGLALVVTFRSSGVVNFAAGAMALYSAYTYGFLRQGQLFSPFPGTPVFIDLGSPMPLVPAMLISLTIAALLGLVVYLAVFRPLRHAPPLTSAVASIGLTIVLQAVLAQRIGLRPILVDAIFPRDTAGLGTATIQLDRIWFAVTIVVIALALAAVFRYTSFGLQTRAASLTEKGAIVTGLAPDRLAAVNWTIAGVVTGLSGILIAPIVPLVPVSYTLFVIPALAAALLGQFKAIAPTVLGALALGALQSEATYIQVRFDWLPEWVVPKSGLPELLPLLFILAVLVVRARPLTARGVDLHAPLGAAPRPRRLVTPAIAGLVIGTIAIFTFGSEWRLALITSLILGVISLSLVLVTGFGGQISLAQLTLAGVAGFLLSTLSDDWGIPFPLAPVLAALGATVVGVAFGLPALRLRGFSLAIVTLALAVALEGVWFRNNDFNGGVDGALIVDPKLLGLDLGIGAGLEFPREEFALLCLVVLVTGAVAVAALRRSRFGAAMMAVRVNERSAAASGVDVVRVKLLLFAIGAFIAGIGGALMAYQQGGASFDLFSTLLGLSLFATAYLAGITSVSGAMVAGLLGASGLVFRALDEWGGLGEWYAAVTGVLLVISLIAFPEGIVGAIHRVGLRVIGRADDAPAGDVSDSHEPGVDPALAARELTPREQPSEPTIALAVEGLTVRYGNVIAVDDVSFDVGGGSITGLIGPNGAGKTTLLDALTGFVPYEGGIRTGDRQIDGLSPFRRARAGVIRTFQAAQLCEDLSVTENLAIGLAAGGSDDDLAATLDLLDLREVSERHVGDLSHGQRQLVALGRAVVGRPRVLLLDEPAAGLDSTTDRWLGERLRRIRETGVTIVLVDHDMGLVMDVCDQILVLDFGSLIANGSTAEVRVDRAVADAYLGRAAGAS